MRSLRSCNPRVSLAQLLSIVARSLGLCIFEHYTPQRGFVGKSDTIEKNRTNAAIGILIAMWRAEGSCKARETLSIYHSTILMTESLRLSLQCNEVSIHVIDPTTGRPIQSWNFRDKFEITIGRSTDQDVAISDPYVSRSHASFVRGESEWVLLSLGKNGVVVGGQQVKEYSVKKDVTFRLGIEGPTLKFSEAEPNQDNNATYIFNDPGEPVFYLDHDRIEREVSDIVEGDFFQNLNDLAKEMRSRRKQS